MPQRASMAGTVTFREALSYIDFPIFVLASPLTAYLEQLGVSYGWQVGQAVAAELVGLGAGKLLVKRKLDYYW
jgi:hypothetical protein